MDKRLIDKVVKILKMNFEDNREGLCDDGYELVSEQIILIVKEKLKNE